jgi:hypothetical protein
MKSRFAVMVLALAIASSAFAQSTDISPARAAAIRECNALANPYGLATWGNWQLYIYRACMAAHGQPE